MNVERRPQNLEQLYYFLLDENQRLNNLKPIQYSDEVKYDDLGSIIHIEKLTLADKSMVVQLRRFPTLDEDGNWQEDAVADYDYEATIRDLYQARQVNLSPKNGSLQELNSLLLVGEYLIDKLKIKLDAELGMRSDSDSESDKEE